MQPWFAVGLMLLACTTTFAQTHPASTSNPGAPPRVLLLVHQQFLPGKAGARQALETNTAAAFDRLAVPVSWIELESLTGPPEALFFDPADSFADIEKAGIALAQLYQAHSDLAQMQGQIMEFVSGSSTVTAVRRDDLGSHADAIDLTKARYLALRVVQIAPAEQHHFEEAEKAAREAASKLAAAPSWVVYEVNAGAPEGTFLVFSSMAALKDLDQALDHPPAADSLSPSSRFAGETNFYVVRPDMSHVSKEFAAGDPAFWIRKPSP